MLLHYFYDTKLAHASYLVGCQATGEAIVIDPGRDIGQLLQVGKKHGLRLVGATETHIHADFVSGVREVAKQTGATLYLSDEGDDDWKYQNLDEYSYRLLKDGDVIEIGKVSLTAVHTPGHTPEHLSFLLTDGGGGADRPMGIFTGDFVFVNAVGRPDLLEKVAGFDNTAVTGAKQLFHSLNWFKQLPDYLQVWPAHGAGSACGKGLGAIPSSTVGYEKLFNPALAYTDEAAFVDYLLADQPAPPPYFAVMKRVNKEGAPLVTSLAQPPRLPAEQLATAVAAGQTVVDTRPDAAFAAKHVAGSINIPRGSLSAWAGWLLSYERPFYLIIDEAVLAETLRDLRYIGLDEVAGYWPTAVVEALADGQSYATYSSDTLAEQLAAGELFLLDVRNTSEWEAGHIAGAHHVPLGELPKRATAVVEQAQGKPIVVNCQVGGRSAIATSLLQAQGAPSVINLAGGLNAWRQAGLPVEK